jgi:vacuolar-type H+-ATPase subunit E/Vma4
MKAWGSAASVIAALRDDATAEVERLEREADASLNHLNPPVAAAPAAPDDGERLARARRAVAELEADEDWQDVVAAAADRDAWIRGVADAGRRAIADAPDALAWTASLAIEAARQLPGTACIVSVPSSLRAAVTDAWRQEIARASGKAVTVEAGAMTAGCIARTPDGAVTFDNRVEAREERSQATWRAAVARIYASAIVPTPETAPA